MIVDFIKGKMGYRLAHLQGRNELIAKAIGYKKGLSLHVFDTTGGWGKEAFLMAALGCHITLFERNPTIAQILSNSLTHAALNPLIAPIAARITFIPTCAIAYLTTAHYKQPDVIYCDPMFEPRALSAAVKKDMQYLQSIVGTDSDAEQLVTLALTIARKKVVVKRAQKAPVLYPNPSASIMARSHRFDVYATKN
jgi:16S rRNA (guanine1516-N2)-methyltransferase